MTPPQCDAVHEGVQCSLDKGHHPSTRHAATTATSLARWDVDHVEVTTWRRHSVPPALKTPPRCPVCHKLLGSDNYRERYCSGKCRREARRIANHKNKINARRRQRRDAAA